MKAIPSFLSCLFLPFLRSLLLCLIWSPLFSSLQSGKNSSNLNCFSGIFLSGRIILVLLLSSSFFLFFFLDVFLRRSSLCHLIHRKPLVFASTSSWSARLEEESVLCVTLVCRFFCVFLESPVVEIPMSRTVAATHRCFNSSLRFSNFWESLPKFLIFRMSDCFSAGPRTLCF